MADQSRQGRTLLSVEVDKPDARSTVVTPTGELDLLTAPRLAERINTELESGPGRMVVDLTRLEFVGSAGLAVLVDTAERTRNAGISLRVVVDKSVAARVLDITGLSDVLPVCDTLDEALDR